MGEWHFQRDDDSEFVDGDLPNAGFWYAVLGLLAALLLGSIGVAYAHGDAWWIQSNPKTQYCCGPDDCRPLANEAVTMTGEGYLVQWEGQEYTFAYRSPDVHASIDERFWFCNYKTDLGEAITFCLFVPAWGS